MSKNHEVEACSGHGGLPHIFQTPALYGTKLRVGGIRCGLCEHVM
jgi:hypothetical protein